MAIKQLLSSREQRTLGMRQRRIYDFLNSRHVGVLSTVTPNSDPHGAVVYYAIDPTFTVHFLTKTGTRKYDNLIHNDHVILTVFDPKLQTTANIIGRSSERGGMHDINQVADAVFTKLTTGEEGMPPIMKLQAGNFTTFEIEPMQIRIAIYARPISGSYDSLFDSIESFEFRDG